MKVMLSFILSRLWRQFQRLGPLFSMVLSLALGWGTAVQALETKIKAEKGVFHAENLDFGDQIYSLDGEWEFHWNDFLDPDGSNAPSGEYLKVPGTWRDSQRSGQGYATYRLSIELKNRSDLGIEIPFMASAGKVFVNGELIFQAGEPGTDKASTRPSRAIGIMPLPASEKLHIVMHVANFNHARGGTWHSISIGKLEQLQNRKIKRLISTCLLMGGVFIIGLYYFAISLLLKDLAAFSFALCCLNFVCAFGTDANTGQILAYLLGQESHGTMFRIAYTHQFTLIGAIYFYVRNIFRTGFPRWLSIFVAASTAGFTLSLLTPTEFFTELLPLNHAFSAVIGAYLVYQSLRHFMIGTTGSLAIVMGGCVLFTVGMVDILLVQFFDTHTLYLIKNGFVVFIICQALAIAQIYNSAFLNLKTEQISNRHSYNQLAKVFYPHQLQAMRDGKELESTMPTTSREACVIALDIVESSQIKHIRTKEFLRNFFRRCYEEMMRNYDEGKLMANGYRIKEMGDGFLCSVGYPFLSATENPADDALELAKKFALILAEEAAMLHSVTPICCGIGIAIGNLTGFYPESGTKEYDLFGSGLVLATRYEGMRKVLFPDQKDKSILIIQEQVYKSLHPSHRSGFALLDIKEMGVVVRDDPAASRIYYRFLAGTGEEKVENLASCL